MSHSIGDMAKWSVIPLRQVLAAATAELSTAGVGSPRVDAELLAAFVLGIPRGGLVAADALRPEQAAEYGRLVAARAARVPLQHLTGEAAFRRLVLEVGHGVFIPRPETELLVEWGLATLRRAGQVQAGRIQAGQAQAGQAQTGQAQAGQAQAGPVVVDLCSGSGAIALAVADECPAATVYAVEREPDALRWLRRNVERHAIAGRFGTGVSTAASAGVSAVAGDRAVAGDGVVAGGGVLVVAGDAVDAAVLAELDGTVELVLCNPPYVPLGTPVEPEVADHDPRTAVFGGPDGLDVIRAVIGRAATLLRPGGWFGVEHDDGHGQAVTDLLRRDGRYAEVTAHRDLAGRPRFATAQRRAGQRLADLPA